MTNMTKLTDMLNLQQKLNDSTNGLGWELGVAENGKLINWKRCVVLELAELIESYPWKHWKDVDGIVYSDNVDIELVDIWHFLMSEILCCGYNVDDIRTLDGFSLLIRKGSRNTTNISIPNQIDEIENLMRDTINDNHILQLTDSFFRLCAILNLSFDRLYKLYIGKNVLNRFRQDHGYKEGTYEKNWYGQEDNAIVYDMISTNHIDSKILYDLMSKYYPK